MLSALSVTASAPREPHSALRRVVHGRVIDAGTGKPVERVPVMVVGDTVGTFTDVDGAFALSGVPSNRSRIEFRHSCYFPVQVAISNDADVEIEIGLPFDQASLRRSGCGGLGARARRGTMR